MVGFTYSQTNPTTTENYIYEKNCLTEDCSKKTESVQYFDGLGRLKQNVAVKATPSGKDIAVPVEYNTYGRQVKSYLPIPQSGTQNGALYTDPLSNASSHYGGEKIYAEKVLEASPLGRVQQQKQIGNDWSSHPVQFSYATNSATDGVKKYTVSTSWLEGRTNSIMSLSGTYSANTLYKSSVTDEDGNITIAFKNKKGQTVLTRKKDGNQNVDTYSIYNEYDQLAYTVPPLASNNPALSQTLLDNLCYQYRYDGWKRLVEKKIPGKGWEHFVYDKQDRVVLAQDANLRTTNNNFAAQGWMFTKYDQFGRVVYTGFFQNTDTRAAMQAALNSMSANPENNEARSSTPFALNGMDVYYTQNAFPTTGNIKVLSVNYYDTYPSYSFNPAFPSFIMGKNILSDNSTGNAVSTKSLPVMSVVKNIEDDNWTKAYMYYDAKGRAIGTYSINHLGGYTKTESDLDFAGLTKQTKVYHKRLNTDIEKVITQTYEYDSQNRLLVHKHKVDNNTEVILSQNEYNELSQLKNKKIGNNLQSIDYTYNIRGWISKINDPSNLNGKLFAYEMKYNSPANPSLSTGKYNGTISEIDWRTSNDQVLRRYSYQYDPLNRLTQGTFQEPDTSLPQNNYFGESAIYDFNGNIVSLQRNQAPYSGSGTTALKMDDLTYNYTGNRLTSVYDSAANYNGYPSIIGSTITYDDNGNMKSHQDKGVLNMQYNYLNLPDQIVFDDYYIVRNNGVNTNYNVNTQYIYRADGTKLKKIYTSYTGRGRNKAVVSTDYLDGFQYEQEGNLSVNLRFVPTSEGYYNFENNTYIYHYKDHLGNIRLSYFNSGAGAVASEENNYYPFGLKHEGYNNSYNLAGSHSFVYKYNNKEVQKETGWLDYGWRQYMPEIGRWNGIDQLAESYLSTSTYAYVANNPISNTDPDGRWINQDGSIGQAPSTWEMLGPKYQPAYRSYQTNFLGVNPGDGGGGGGSYTFTGNAAGSMYNYFVNGGSIDGISFVNGEARWYTLDGTDSMYVDSNGMANVSSADMTMHRAKLTGNDYYMDYWGLLNTASTTQSYATNGIGLTLGTTASVSNDLVSAGKMIKTSNIFKTYNLYRSNGYLNGNQYISGRKFLNNVKGINALNNSKVVKGVARLGLLISFEQFRQTHHPGYISRGIVSFGVGFVPYSGPAASLLIDNSNVNYWNIWTWGDPE